MDTGDYYPQQCDARIQAIEEGMVESRWVAQQLGRPVSKAFNNIYADHLQSSGRLPGTPGPIALPVAGYDDNAKAVVMQLIDELGFGAVDAGSLDQSWRQQPGTPVYTTDLDADGVRRALAEASPQRSPQWRATSGGFLDPRKLGPITMLSWGVIAYGAALSAVLAVLLALAARARAPAVLVAVAVGAFAGPVVWNTILRATAADQFFVDAPIPFFPVSWQDTGSGVFALAAAALVLGCGPLRTGSGGRVALLSVLGAVAALVVDIYLY